MITDISDQIESVTQSLGHIYLRATDAEQNLTADQIRLSGGQLFVIFNNLPEIETEVSQGGAVRFVPISVRVLGLDNHDSTTSQGDLIRDACLSVCEKVFDTLSDLTSSAEIIEGYSISFENEEKVHDKILTGAELSFDLPVRRTTYYNCC